MSRDCKTNEMSRKSRNNGWQVNIALDKPGSTDGSVRITQSKKVRSVVKSTCEQPASRTANKVILSQEAHIASVDSEEKVQKTMTDYLKSDINSQNLNCSQMFQKLNLQQRAAFNRMRFVELNCIERKKEALKQAFHENTQRRRTVTTSNKRRGILKILT